MKRARLRAALKIQNAGASLVVVVSAGRSQTGAASRPGQDHHVALAASAPRDAFSSGGWGCAGDVLDLALGGVLLRFERPASLAELAGARSRSFLLGRPAGRLRELERSHSRSAAGGGTRSRRMAARRRDGQSSRSKPKAGAGVLVTLCGPASNWPRVRRRRVAGRVDACGGAEPGTRRQRFPVPGCARHRDSVARRACPHGPPRRSSLALPAPSRYRRDRVAHPRRHRAPSPGVGAPRRRRRRAPFASGSRPRRWLRRRRPATTGPSASAGDDPRGLSRPAAPRAVECRDAARVRLLPPTPSVEVAAAGGGHLRVLRGGALQRGDRSRRRRDEARDVRPTSTGLHGMVVRTLGPLPRTGPHGSRGLRRRLTLCSRRRQSRLTSALGLATSCTVRLSVDQDRGERLSAPSPR